MYPLNLCLFDLSNLTDPPNKVVATGGSDHEHVYERCELSKLNGCLSFIIFSVTLLSSPQSALEGVRVPTPVLGHARHHNGQYLLELHAYKMTNADNSVER